MSKTKLIGLSIFLALTLTFSACGKVDQQNPPQNNNDIGLPNPASVYCLEQGGTLEMREDENGTYGVCIFPDGSECDEWAYFRKECQPGGQEQSPNEQSQGLSEDVIAWYGRVVSSGMAVPAESKLLIAPEGTGEVFVTGVDGEIESLIVSIRDKEPPANKANFWGHLDCPTAETCLLTVTQIRIDSPGVFLAPEPVEGWEGTIITTRTEPGSGGDDCLVVSGMFEIGYGLWSMDEAVNQQIEALRDTGQVVRIWGEMVAGIPDWNGTQIQVNRIEVVQ